MTKEKYYRKGNRVKLTDAEALALDLFFQNKLGIVEVFADYGKYKATINDEIYHVKYVAARPWTPKPYIEISVRWGYVWWTVKVIDGRRLAEYKHMVNTLPTTAAKTAG
jgi:hypothetical protein